MLDANSKVALSKLLSKQEQGDFFVDIGDSRRKRDQSEIIAEILLFCHAEIGRTRLMYATNLNYKQLNNNLEFLLSRGLLASENKRYVTTKKGFAYLELFASIYDMLVTEDSAL